VAAGAKTSTSSVNVPGWPVVVMVVPERSPG